MILLLLRLLTFLLILVVGFALYVSYTYGITIDEWFEQQRKFWYSNEKSDEEKERDMKKESSKR